jgi:iron complex transport system ATP-binding protein
LSFRLRELHFAYRPSQPVLRGIDLQFAGGEFVTLLGPNGAGKSTLLRVMAGLVAAQRGELRYSDRELSTWPRRELARHIAFLPQSVESVYGHTVQETVELARHPHLGAWGRLGEEDHRAVEEAMERTEVTGFAPRSLRELSGGERQRVLLAAALAQGGEFLLLDEPTASLDLHHQVRLMSLLGELARAGRGVLCATHDLNLAASFADRVILLHEGRCVADGPPREVLESERLARVYGEGIWVGEHPASGQLAVLPRVETKRGPR